MRKLPASQKALRPSKPKRTAHHNINAGVNRVLGGGVVPGSLVLIGGDPGIGKSTLLLQVSSQLADKELPVLYISGEESIRQTKLRADRLGVTSDQLYVLSETNLFDIVSQIEQIKPAFVVIDSIQTVYREEVTSAPGSVSQVRESTSELMKLSKSNGIPILSLDMLRRKERLPDRGCLSIWWMQFFTLKESGTIHTGYYAVSRIVSEARMKWVFLK